MKERFRFPLSVWFILALFIYQIVDMVISITIKKRGFIGFANEYIFNDIYDSLPNANIMLPIEYREYWHVFSGIIRGIVGFLLSPLEYAVFYEGIGELQYLIILFAIFFIFLLTVILKFKHWSKVGMFFLILSPLSNLKGQ
jgi:hypothetical protein